MNAALTTRDAGAPSSHGAVELGAIWGWSILVALLGSWTCFDAVAGLNWALWTLAAAAGFFVIGRRARAVGRCAAAALILACVLAGSSVVTASAHAEALIFLGTAALCGFAVLAITKPLDSLGPAELARAPLALLRLVLSEAGARIAQTFGLIRMSEAVPVVRGGVMAAVISGTLFLLLSAANPTLADWRDAAWASVVSWTFVARDLFFLALATVLLGTYGLASGANDSSARGQRPGQRVNEAEQARYSDVERLLVLGAAFGLYLLFFAVELSDWLGPRSVHLAPGETYAEATHRGFGEMIASAALCALVILLLDRRALRGRREPLVRGVAWALIGASLIVVASAYAKVRFYEAAYGYTEPRLRVQFGCAAIACGLLLLAFELRSRIDLPRLIRRAALVAIACIAVLGYWNTSEWIVNANVERFARTGKLDAIYLGRLARVSPDAVPALIHALPRIAPADAQYLRGVLAHTSTVRSIFGPARSAGALSWYEWSVRRAAATSALRATGL
ncbi:MAG TPA: DUF4173 domain-containing protein, partial [Steroidobacteraceae bacterium]